jgi:hypothetical protein
MAQNISAMQEKHEIVPTYHEIIKNKKEGCDIPTPAQKRFFW